MTPAQLTGTTDSHLQSTMVGQKAFLMHPDVANDLLNMIEAAKKAGFKMEIASGFRDFSRQRAIWNGKFEGELPILDSNSQPLNKAALSNEEKLKAILRWSALPGGSRHHWGCDFDVYARNLLPSDTKLQLEPWEYLEGHQLAFYCWLKEHIDEFGFFFPYLQDLGGVAIEPWHISHKTIGQQCAAQLNAEMLKDELVRQNQQHNIAGLESILNNLDSILSTYIRNITPPPEAL
ncbi:M15 family metallopeptidase [Vibrio parahaemolyticus]|uniref:M15 family metallopeptidase n=1 Tax=Vibrio parahaemolyticus TaxID=670 RepID=UPI0005F10C0F|nr:M15 family metallopeptidase [Vibrio parahaemolyticus]EGQ7817429.1 M15 family metallopeptidase [Vibrio parahaemolyticus]EGQ8512017.1 D-alanyl-D-alanine carboxypeptidase family protein [Vibrio parahaemolyticus]EGQ8701254.1 D-alanyl-D-alanine carboxypeptidase family protein [Vibrio parahaemolyticus]EGQ9118722.1 D-alanyl-D-alanine carboxypeptidase family protein [Vibrio parahaemolyticus]EGQ9474741.1 M15 family metallopeptidase [Vibrio parahaemolyticus]